MKKITIISIIIMMMFIIIPKNTMATDITYKIGDINNDEVIDSRDTLRILEHIAASTIPKINKLHPEWILKDNQLKAADINGDGAIDSRDILRELEYIAASTIPKIGNTHPEWKKYIEEKWKIEATGIKLDKTNMTIYKGKIGKLSATVVPANTINKIIKWSSSNAKVATVDGLGNVTGKSNGIAIITAITSNGKKATCTVTVKTPEAKTVAVSSVTLKQIDRTIAVDTSIQLNAIVQPTNATNKTLTWSSSDNNIAKVDKNGVVKGIKPGKVTITVKTSNNKKATCIIRVNIPAKSISLNKTSTTMSKGEKIKLTVKFNPTNTTSKIVKWSSSNTNVVTVNSSGEIKAINKGTAIITTTTIYGKIAKCNITVNEMPKIENQKVVVNGKTITKAQYANFRNVSGGKIGPNVLYRCINPIHGKSKAKGKYATAGYYADQMLKEHKVNAILNLDNNSSDIRKSSYPKSTYYRTLFNAGKVCARSISGVKEGKDWQRGIVDRIKFFAKNEGPYAVHCWIGRDRTGFVIILLECLMDVPFENMYNDYIESDKNFKLSGRFNENTIPRFAKYLRMITGKSASNSNKPKASDWKNVNFVKCAENYLKGGGMTDKEIATLKKHLSTSKFK